MEAVARACSTVHFYITIDSRDMSQKENNNQLTDGSHDGSNWISQSQKQ